MHKSKKIMLAGWGNFRAEECHVFRPEKQNDVADIVKKHGGKILARGLGRSYGDAAINHEGIISSERLNRFIDFDIDNGTITAEGGTNFKEILDIIIPKGWFLPVIPGTKYVTLGGAIAADVHGKNHYKLGDIGEHISGLVLVTVQGEEIACSSTSNPYLFAATIGGLGMTGYIRQATLKLIPIGSASLTSWRAKVNNIEEMVENLRKYKADSDYMIGWIDHFASGENLGKGIFEKSSHAPLGKGTSLGKYLAKEPRFTVPKLFPAFILNKYSMALYNRWRFLRESKKGRSLTQTFDEFFHPLDSLKSWNRLYGKKGLLQYQFMIPEGKNAAIDLENILRLIQASGNFSFLAVIKYHRESKGLMTFPTEGFSLALDFPATREVFTMLDKIDEELLKIGGRIYLAKDARAKAFAVEQMYGENFKQWKEYLKKIDPHKKISSAMSERLGFKVWQ